MGFKNPELLVKIMQQAREAVGGYEISLLAGPFDRGMDVSATGGGAVGEFANPVALARLRLWLLATSKFCSLYGLPKRAFDDAAERRGPLSDGVDMFQLGRREAVEQGVQ